jgi:hypothetical protein
MKAFTESTKTLRAVRESQAALQIRLDRNVLALTMAPYQSICYQVTMKLPRELRDEVYGYIHGNGIVTLPTSIDDIASQMGLNMIQGWALPSLSTLPFPTLEYWLGNVLAQELVEHWYHNTWFVLTQQSVGMVISRSTEDICIFLEKDMLGSNVRPSQFIRQVTVAFYYVPQYRKLLREAISHELAYSLRPCETGLRKLKPGTNIEICIDVSQVLKELWSPESIQALVKEMIPSLISLLKHGCHLTLEYTHLGRTSSFRAGNYTLEMMMEILAKVSANSMP